MPGAVWLGLSGSAGKGEWKLRIKENGNGEDNFTHAAIIMIQRRWRSAYLSMLIDANRENSNCLPRSLPSVISRLNSQWGIRGS